MKKRPFSLLETLIALSLFSLVFVLVLNQYKQMMQSSAHERDSQRTFRELCTFEERLQAILSHATQLRSTDKTLFFAAEGLLDLDPRFSGHLHGAFYLDADDTLWLVEQGTEEKAFRKTIMLTECRDLAWRFLQGGNWLGSWESGTLPSFCQMQLSYKSKPIALATQLPNAPLQKIFSDAKDL